MARQNKGKMTLLQFTLQREGELIKKSISIRTPEFGIDSRETFEDLHNALFNVIEAYKKEYDLR